MRKRQHSEAEIEQMLSRYLQGNLSNEDKRVLDKYSLDDPFLAEAMQGYIEQGLDLRNDEIKALREAIVTPKRPNKVTTYKWLKWAAVLFGFAFIGGMGYQLMIKQSDSSQIVSTAPEKETSPIAQVFESSDEKEILIPEENKLEPIKAEETTTAQAEKKKRKNHNKPSSNSTNANSTKKRIPKNTSQTDKIKTETTDIESNTSYVLDGVAVNKSTFESENSGNNNTSRSKMDNVDDLAAATADKEIQDAERKRYGNVYIEDKAEKDSPTVIDLKQKKRIIAVKVVDQGGNALIGANIIAGEEGALSNFDGYATFEIDTSTIMLNTNYIGYSNATTLLIDSISFYRIELVESQMLDEVVVTELPESKTIAAPEGGWNLFETYADQQLSNVVQTSQSGGMIRGEVEIQFKIKKNGDLIEFVVLKSLNASYDRAVIDMVKSYGKWVTNPAETETITTFRYIF